MSLWLHVQTQWRAGGLGVVGLDYPAIRTEARALEIYLGHGLMRKIQAIEYHELKSKKNDGHEDSDENNGSP